MMAVIPIPTKLNCEAAWNRYAALAIEASQTPRLLDDHQHEKRRVAAHEEFSAIFAKLHS